MGSIWGKGLKEMFSEWGERYFWVGRLWEDADAELVEGGVAGGEEFEVFEVDEGLAADF